ncbi:MAG: TRAP transporter small permease [Mesorhizobium sp.]|nr:TRAP transporter small permease [Mesorhizobium sp.]MCO5162238.1 TRAP transporter small permease [Mesorhizobium sp.]
MTIEDVNRLNIKSTRLLALVGLAALLVIAVATLADVGARWLFSSPITGVYDLSTLFIAVAMAACFPAALAERRNIRIEFGVRMMPKRLRLFFDVLADSLTLAFFALLGWQLIIYTGEVMLDGETSFTLQLPVAPWWVATTSLFILCIPVQSLALFLSIRSMLLGMEVERPHQTEEF